jgi:hypothetical protein
MKPSSFMGRPSVLASSIIVVTLALPAFAQDGPASPDDTVASPGAEEPAPSAPPPPPADPPPEPAPAGQIAPASPAPAPFVVGAKQVDRPEDEAAAEPDDGKLRYHQDHFLGFAGVRVAKISHAGLDPFSDSDELAQFSVGAGGTLMTADAFSLAGLFLYDIGGHSDEARGAETSLTVHRLTIGAEARYHFIRQLFVFGRVAPGAIHSIAKLDDEASGAQTLVTRDWVFAADLSAGAMLELSGWSGDSRKRRPNIWIAFDGGYGYAGESELSLGPEGNSGPERAEPVELGTLGLGGPFLRFAAVMTY